MKLWHVRPRDLHEPGQYCNTYDCSGVVYKHEYDALAAEVAEQARLLGMSGSREAALLARLAEAEGDAKRYRWLKEHCVKYYSPPGFLLEWAHDTNDLDAAVDAMTADSAPVTATELENSLCICTRAVPVHPCCPIHSP